MEKFIQYVSTSAGRNKVVRNLQMFTMAGSVIVTAILLSATFMR